MAISPDSSIDLLGMTKRSSNALKADGIRNVAELIAQTDNELSKVPNLGRKSLAEVQYALVEHGFTLREYKPKPKKKSFYVRALPEHHDAIMAYAAQLGAV